MTRVIETRPTFHKLITLFCITLCMACSSSDDAEVNTDDTGKEIVDVLDDSKNMGVNFNEQLHHIDNDRLLALQTTWVRGFVNFFKYYEDPSLLDTDAKITKYLTLHTNNFKTVLNIKYKFRGKDYPAEGSQEMQDQMDFLETLLDKIWNKTDIIVVGNEPFLETDLQDLGPGMYTYYVKALNVVKEYAEIHGKRAIFFGSFDNMYEVEKQELKVLNDLLDYSKENSWIAGVDMHIHHFGPTQMETALDYVSARVRDDQKILVTEFSLMKHFRSNLTGIIPENFANTYGFSPALHNYEYLDYAYKNHVERQQWVAFLSQSPWFENRKHYLSNSFYDVFSKYDQFFLANYAYRQGGANSDITANTNPWILNGLYANRTVEPDPGTGQFQFNYAWAEDFKAIQNQL